MKQELVKPIAEPAAVVNNFNLYQELCKQILSPQDRMLISGKEYKKKSGWRKLALAYGISWSITHRELLKNEHSAGVIYRIRAQAGNGRYAEAEGFAANNEKGMINKPFSYVVMFAQTRALNKALAEMIAPNEISAEEITGEEVQQNEEQHGVHSGEEKVNLNAFLRDVSGLTEDIGVVKLYCKKTFNKNLHQCSSGELGSIIEHFKKQRDNKYLEVF